MSVKRHLSLLLSLVLVIGSIQNVHAETIDDSNDSVIESTENTEETLLQENTLDEFSQSVSNQSIDLNEINAGESEFATKRLIVQSQSNEFDTYGAVSYTGFQNVYILQYDTIEATEAAFKSLSVDEAIESVDADAICNTEGIEGTEDIKDVTNETKLVPLSENGKDVTIALLDSGVDTSSERLLDGTDVTGSKDGVTDINGHGTRMQKILESNTPSNVRLYPIKIFNEEGKSTVVDLYVGLLYAEQAQVDIINLSLTMKSSASSVIIEDKINELTEAGVAVVVSAGNYSENVASYCPANVDSAIVVGASDVYGERQEYSNFGDTLDYLAFSEEGTSGACALVSSMTANLLSSGNSIDSLIAYANSKNEKKWDEYYGNGVLSYTNFLLKNNADENVDIITPPGGSLTNDIVVTQTAYALHLYFGFYTNPWNNSAGEGVYWMTSYTEEMNVATSFTMPAQFSWMLNGFYDGWTGAYNAMYYNAAGTGTHIVHSAANGNVVANWNTSLITKFFDVGQYGALNPDVNSATNGNVFHLWNHYLLSGINEGRATSYIFNPQEYKALYGDLANSYGNNWWCYAAHFAQFGYSEGRWGTYNVTTFNANGGTCSTNTMNTSYNKPLGTTAANHTAANILPVPTRSGYIFTGWYTSPSGGTLMQWNTTCPYYTDFTLYAHWARCDRATIVASPTSANYTIYANVSKSTTAAISFPTWSSSVSNGTTNQDDLVWYTATAGSYTVNGQTYNYACTINANSHNGIDATMATYIYCEGLCISTGLNSYKLRNLCNFQPNGGTTVGSVSTYKYTNVNLVVPNNPTRTGYTLAGWGTSSTATSNESTIVKSGSSWVYTTTALAVNGSTFYARWTPNTYTIAYNANGGLGTVNSGIYTYDSTKALVTNTFSRAGFEFVEWNTKADGSGTSYKDKQSVLNLTSTNNATITLYAQWKLIPITVSMPKTLIMNSDGCCDFEVSADNEVGTVRIILPDSVEMKQANKNSVAAVISTDKKELTPVEQKAVVHLSAPLTAGTWNTSFNIGIKFAVD